LRSVTPPQNVIPRLAPEFFDSAFFWRFQIQRTYHLHPVRVPSLHFPIGPILEPLEFRDRYLQFIKGNPDALQVPGQLIAMALVVWAASFGVNEYGMEDPQESPADIRQRKEQINEMLQEILYLVDLHGVLRKASWDGVRLLLLLLPLTQGRIFVLDYLFRLVYVAQRSSLLWIAWYGLCLAAPSLMLTHVARSCTKLPLARCTICVASPPP
jgi:hypothetical protein